MLSENLKAARKAKGLTQAELAARLHVVRQTVSKWEKGLSVPDAQLLIRLAAVLEVPVSALLGAAREETAVGEQLSCINQQLAGSRRFGHRAGKALLVVACGFAAYLAGAVIEIRPGVNLPGFGLLLAVLAVGGILAFYSSDP